MTISKQIFTEPGSSSCDCCHLLGPSCEVHEMTKGERIDRAVKRLMIRAMGRGAAIGFVVGLAVGIVLGVMSYWRLG